MESQTSPKSKSRRRGQKPQFSPSGAPLHLSTLPRFHPATYGSTSSSMSTTPSSSVASPQPPLSPRTQQRMHEAQKQLSHYQQNLIAQYSSRDQNSGSFVKPDSPKLAPLAGSPGPVTPLELEEDEYLTAGSTGKSANLSVDAIIGEEAKRRGDISSLRKQ